MIIRGTDGETEARSGEGPAPSRPRTHLALSTLDRDPVRPLLGHRLALVAPHAPPNSQSGAHPGLTPEKNPGLLGSEERRRLGQREEAPRNQAAGARKRSAGRPERGRRPGPRGAGPAHGGGAIWGRGHSGSSPAHPPSIPSPPAPSLGAARGRSGHARPSGRGRRRGAGGEGSGAQQSAEGNRGWDGDPRRALRPAWGHCPWRRALRTAGLAVSLRVPTCCLREDLRVSAFWSGFLGGGEPL